MLPTPDLPAHLSAAITSFVDGDVDGWMNLYAHDAVHEFPLAAAGDPAKVEGRAAIHQYMTDLLRHRIAPGSITNFRIHETSDEYIIEAEGDHRTIGDGSPVHVRYVWFVSPKTHPVRRFRDYTYFQPQSSDVAAKPTGTRESENSSDA